MTLKLIHMLGYRLPDLAWLKWQDLECLWTENEEPESDADASEAAFSL